MSQALYDADEALAYTSPPYLPIVVLAVGYGAEQGAPDLYPTVEATWRFTDRIGSFTTTIGYASNWRYRMDAALRVAVFTMQSIYALLGGWPAPTPLEAYPVDVPPDGSGSTPGGNAPQ